MACNIRVETYKMEMRRVEGTIYQSGTWVQESSKVVSHENASDRKWLANHCHWAFRNGRRVVSTPTGLSNDQYIAMGRGESN